MTDNKGIAAIWARVSTSGQKETSLPSQVARCREKLAAEGYHPLAEYIFTVDWTSLELTNCPEYIDLLSLIMSKKIQAVGVYDRDRLAADYSERLLFLTECKRAGVKVIPCEGNPIEDSDTGELIEHVLTLGKKQAVLRAQISSRQGLHDRITLKRKPATFKTVYGYTWLKKELKLVPNDDLVNVKLIIKLLLENQTYDSIIKELEFRGIVSPAGLKRWNKTAIHYILNNPVYAGRYYGLKKTSVLPKTRKSTKSYGRTSAHTKDLNEAEYLPEVKILEPVLTWEQREQLIDQAKNRQWLSKRNANYDYLLRGFIRCGEHTGINGKPRIYHGKPYHDSYAYVCPVGKCFRPLIPGPLIDDYVKGLASRLITGSLPGSEYFKDNFENLFSDSNQKNTKTDIENNIEKLSQKANKILDKQIDLQDQYLSKEIDKDVYEGTKQRYQFELTGINKQRDDFLDKLNQIKNREQAIINVQKLQSEFIDKIDKDTSNEFIRRILSAFNFSIKINTKEEREVKINVLTVTDSKTGITTNISDAEKDSLRNMTKFHIIIDTSITIGIPNMGNVNDILTTAFDDPVSCKRNKRVYPIVLSLVNSSR